MPRFQKQLIWADLSNAQGSNATGVVNGVLQDGPLTGIDITSYNPSGARIDKIGNVGFRVPLDVRRSLGVGPGSQIRFYESYIVNPSTGLPDPVAHAIVEARSEKISQDGMWAEFTCPDVMQELVYAMTGGGFAFGLADTVQSVLSQLVARQDETPWVASNFITGFDGMSFSGNFTSVYDSANKLLTMCNGHLRRGAANGGRELVTGTFGAISGIQFQRPSKIAGRRNPAIRAIATLEVDLGGAIINDITPTGAGNGITALTLGELAPVDANGNPQLNTLFATGGIPGFNPLYPIKARKRMDNGGLDGYDYYIDDPNSVLFYRRQAKGMSRTDIIPITTALTDKLFAAGALYTAAVTTLSRNAAPLTTIKVTTYAYPGLDNRWLAGSKVFVNYQKTNARGDLIVNLNDYFYVVDCNRRITDGRMTDEWVLSSNGEWESSSLNAIVVGSTQAIDTIRVAPQIYPSESNIFFSEEVGPGADIIIHIPGSKAYVRTLSGLFNFYLQQLRGTVGTTLNGPHAHTTNVPAQGVPEPAHNTVTPNHGHTLQGTSSGVAGESGTLYDPHASLVIEAKGSHSGYALYQSSDSSQDWLLADGGHFQELHVDAAVFDWASLVGHEHDMSSTTTNASTGGVTLASNTKTVPPSGLTTAQAGYGNQTSLGGSFFGTPTAGGDHTHDQSYTVINVGNPPTGVQIIIDNGTVIGPSSNPATFLGVDLGKYFNDQQDHILLVRSATIGRVQGTGTIRRHVTTVATS